VCALQKSDSGGRCKSHRATLIMNSNHSKKDPRHLESKLLELPHSHQLAFAAACCERAYPNYLRFFQLARWGGPLALRASLDRAWDFIESSTPVLTDIEELEKKCEAVTPDLDDFSTAEIDLEAAAAQEAAFMVRLLLQFCGDSQVSYALRIATFATDTIDMYVQAIEKIVPADPQLDEKVAHHPLMIREISRQEDDVLQLAQIKSQLDLQEFRRYATHPEMSNIGLTYPARSAS
jgi:uncharacterized protein